MDFCIIPETFEAAGEVKAVNPPNKETSWIYRGQGSRSQDQDIWFEHMYNLYAKSLW